MRMNVKLASRGGRKSKVPNPNRGADHVPFGTMLRRLRQQKGVGLRELARKIGVSAPYLSNVERGKSPTPSEQKLRAIAGILHSSPELLASTRPSEIMVLDPACGTAQTLGEALRELRLE